MLTKLPDFLAVRNAKSEHSVKEKQKRQSVNVFYILPRFRGLEWKAGSLFIILEVPANGMHCQIKCGDTHAFQGKRQRLGEGRDGTGSGM